MPDFEVKYTGIVTIEITTRPPFYNIKFKPLSSGKDTP
jgi:hypothetical protein